MSTRTGGWGPTPDAHDFPTRRYDLVKEFVIALAVVTVLSVVAALVFSSPDDPAISLQQWARQAPADVVATAAGELAGTTTSAGYGAPYNTAGTGQTLGPVNLQTLPGVTQPVDSAKDLVLDPVRTLTSDTAAVAAVRVWDAASADQQQAWSTAYSDALAKAPDGDPAKVAGGDYGPVPAIAAAELAARRQRVPRGTAHLAHELLRRRQHQGAAPARRRDPPRGRGTSPEPRW